MVDAPIQSNLQFNHVTDVGERGVKSLAQGLLPKSNMWGAGVFRDTERYFFGMLKFWGAYACHYVKSCTIFE